MKTNKENALQLIEQMLEEAIAEDLVYKKLMTQANKASKATGESKLIYQLKTLKQALENIN